MCHSCCEMTFFCCEKGQQTIIGLLPCLYHIVNLFTYSLIYIGNIIFILHSTLSYRSCLVILCLILKNMKEHQKQLLYYVVVRSYSTLQYAELNGKTDRNVRGVRETAIKQIRKKYKTALETRLLHLPWTLTLDEKYFLENGVRTKDEKNSEKQ